MGEAGIGKTRTSLAVAAIAAERGLRVFLGRCLEEEGAPPYRPWVQILLDLIGARAPNALDPTLDPSLVAALRTLIGVDADRAAGAPQTPATRFALFDAVVRVLAGATRERPLLLLLEDLHRADPSSLRLLHHVVAEIPSLPLMILGTLRDASPDASPELMRALKSCNDRHASPLAACWARSARWPGSSADPSRQHRCRLPCNASSNSPSEVTGCSAHRGHSTPQTRPSASPRSHRRACDR
jgi:hypothetical protein